MLCKYGSRVGTVGMIVQYSWENCVKCSCNGDGQGVTCCSIVPYPIVKSQDHCYVWLNTNTCSYERRPKLVHGGHACCIVEYEVSNLEDKRVPQKVKDLLEKADV
ncbi:hypothetical protein HOLleu_17526 [Holothuria leucospilota]|uniref:Uncharacterized protein n=1 Tax=Holothuria leucospilota TaxID=206669 RepID=A0A9Q1C2F1_HOLLE|nr:hypothetical protein HOLleu_17526 [Holothuria leucospilota]